MAFTLCARRRFVPCGCSSPAWPVGDNLFCLPEGCRPRSEGLRDGVEGTEGVPSSFLVLEDEATVLRAKLGTSEAFFAPSVCELLFSDEAAPWPGPCAWGWAWAKALMVERQIFSSGAGLGTFLRGLALGLWREAFLGANSRAHLEMLPARLLPLWAFDSLGGKLEWRGGLAAFSLLPLAGVL